MNENEYKLKIEQLRKLLRSAKNFNAAIALALDIHAMTHTREVSKNDTPSYCDELLDGLANDDFNIMPTEKHKSIAYHLWHIARIEDLVGNLLIAEQPQIFNDAWISKMNVSVCDTGNAMTHSEIAEFSEKMNKRELIHYRNAVGCNTREILKSLTPADLKRKPKDEMLTRIVNEGGLLEVKDSIWLKDFWGRHTVAGLVALPLTRHHMMHLPECFEIKQAV